MHSNYICGLTAELSLSPVPSASINIKQVPCSRWSTFIRSRKQGGRSVSLQAVVTFPMRCGSGYGIGWGGGCPTRKHDSGLKAVAGIYNYCDEHRLVLRTCKIIMKKNPKQQRYKQYWQWKREMTVCFCPFKHSVWQMPGKKPSPRL